MGHALIDRKRLNLRARTALQEIEFCGGFPSLFAQGEAHVDSLIVQRCLKRLARLFVSFAS